MGHAFCTFIVSYLGYLHMSLPINIRHLWSRLGFGINPANYPIMRDGDLIQNINELSKTRQAKPIAAPLSRSTDLNPDRIMAMSPAEKVEFLKSEEDRLNDLRDRWLDQMANQTENALVERMTLFWHGHLTCVCRESAVAASYLNTLRRHALGNFGEMLQAIAKEPAMIRFLNNQQNRKAHANENFARELLELFTLGEGNYTESDVRNAARAFTGWSTGFDNTFEFRERQHDFGQKIFLGKEGNFNGDDIIKIILQQPKCANFVASQIYRYFVNEVPNHEHIAQLGGVLYQSNYDIKTTMLHLMRSDWFYDAENLGNRIKSPVELIVQTTQLFGTSYEGQGNRTFLQRSLGQLLFSPPNVAGWPGGRHWINNATLLIRLNLPSYILKGDRMDHTVLRSLKSEGPGKPVQYLQVESDLEPLLSYFRHLEYGDLEGSLKESVLLQEKSLDLTTPREHRSKDFLERLLLRITSLPEFQLG